MIEPKKIDDDNIFLFGMLAAISITMIGLTFAVTCLDWTRGSNGPPSIGSCTLDVNHIRCVRDMGGEPHHYYHRNFTVIEETK